VSGAGGRTVQERARASLGSSNEAVYRMVARALAEWHPGGGTLVDVGCGGGQLWGHVRDRFDAYLGVDVVRYDGFPEGADFRTVDLDTGRVDLPDGSADVAASVETIEHVENPRALVRELARLARPGGLVIVTTPNQLSLLSKLGLVLQNQYPYFKEGPGLYPAHITALLETDLLRMARECGLTGAAVRYSDRGRVPGTPWHWPRPLRGRAFSDNVLLGARRP
jgi:2-polyprenyl-3-methyl-5-hydroxy-6-metoxy-1,4-benzoquinol methylase